MTADEMFSRCGYVRDLEKEKQDPRMIYLDNSGEDYSSFIIIDSESEDVTLTTRYKKLNEVDFSFFEIKAIAKKLEEMGW